MADLAYVLLSAPALPDPAKVVASAATMGFTLTNDSNIAGENQGYELGDGRLFMVALMPTGYPGASKCMVGTTSVEPAIAGAAPAHLIVAGLNFEGSARERDTQLAALTSAVIDNVPAVAAKLGHGTLLHRADVFSKIASHGPEEGGLASVLAIDITSARESRKQMSMLTHNMSRYGREDFFVTCPIKGTGAMDYVMGLADWMLSEPDYQLPTGDTIGRTERERVLVQRVPSPMGNGETVIRLDLR
jgi:hypothetical protein